MKGNYFFYYSPMQGEIMAQRCVYSTVRKARLMFGAG